VEKEQGKVAQKKDETGDLAFVLTF